MKVKTATLTGPALDWAVAMAKGIADDCEVHASTVWYGRVTSGFVQHKPSTDWAQGGPIIEREGIGTAKAENDEDWIAMRKYNLARDDLYWCGPTPLVAAMRCFVASKLGDEVDIPEGLA